MQEDQLLSDASNLCSSMKKQAGPVPSGSIIIAISTGKYNFSFVLWQKNSDYL